MTRPAWKAEAPDRLAAAGLGVVAFLLWAGPRVLDPNSTGWLQTGDRAMHTIGWWYFKNSPWGMPLGVNPRNGLEIGNSVALSDSLPLFALPFKLLAPILPATFQYWGLWLLLSMVLQAVVGLMLAREMRLGRLTSLIFAAFLILTPAFLFRLPLHMALAGHWVILAALYLYVRQTPPPRYLWILLIAVTAAIHAYLLAMVMAIWLASLLQRGLLSLGSALEFVGAMVAALFVLWTSGFLVISSFGAAGFGFYRTNLLSLIDPDGWSRLLPALPHTRYDYEGMVFPGLGALLLLAVALIFAMPLLRRIFSERWMPLLLAMLALLAFAISPRPVIGQFELGVVPLPTSLLSLGAMFRASGRMIWPVGYLLLLTIFVLLDRRFGAKRLAAMAGVALAIQAFDMSLAWQSFARQIAPMPYAWSSPMISAFWNVAPQHYSKVRAIPVKVKSDSWSDLSFYAAFHGMGSDAVNLARTDAVGFVHLEAKAAAALQEGSFEPDALYILDQPSAALARRFANPGDLLAKIDKYYVFARGGAAFAEMPGVTPGLAPLPSLLLGQTVDFRTPGTRAQYLPDTGWLAKPWAAQFSPMNATLGFHLPNEGPHILHLVLATQTKDLDFPPVSIELDVDGQRNDVVAVPSNGTTTADLPIPPQGVGGDAVIGFRVLDSADPTNVSETLPDVGVVSMTLLPQ